MFTKTISTNQTPAGSAADNHAQPPSSNITGLNADPCERGIFTSLDLGIYAEIRTTRTQGRHTNDRSCKG